MTLNYNVINSFTKGPLPLCKGPGYAVRKPLAVLPLLSYLGRQGAVEHYKSIGRNADDSMVVLKCPLQQGENPYALSQTARPCVV